MKLKMALIMTGAVLVALVARAAVITYDQALVSTPALGYSATYTLDLQANGITSVSAQAVYSSATVASVTFQDGAQSTGSFTVSNFANLVASSATDTVTVTGVPTSNSDLYISGNLFANGVDWATGGSAALTAASLASAIASRLPSLVVSTSGAAITITAPLGANYNAVTVVSNDTALTVAHPTLTGGRNNAWFSVNGVVLTQGGPWTAATSNAATATSIASAINGLASLSSVVTAGASGSVVTSTSALNGSVYNYPLVSSDPTDLTASGANMVNGANAAFALNGKMFTATGGNALTTALPVLYTSGTVTVSGLTNQTTYYAVPAGGNTFQLAKYSTSAVADAAGGSADLVVVNSTTTQLSTSEHTFTLALTSYGTFVATSAYTWSQSLDNVNWTSVSNSSATSFVSPSSTTFWNFGNLGTRYLRLNTTAPTSGAEALTVTVLGTP